MGTMTVVSFFIKIFEKEVLIPILKHFDLKYPYFLRDKIDLDSSYEVGEVMMHPGFLEKWRIYDLVKCLNPELKKNIEEKNIEIISFSDLK